MLDLLLWLTLPLGFIALGMVAWRGTMRRRGFRLVRMLDEEGVLRYAVDVPVAFGEGRRPGQGPFAGRGTLVLTRKRLAGFAHRRRFVLVRTSKTRKDAIRAEDGCLVIRMGGVGKGGAAPPPVRFRVPDAESWSADARKVLRA